MTEYIKQRITRYWENAKIDYDIDGRFIDCKLTGDRLIIRWEEEGTRYTGVINHANDYTPEQLFDIWCESDWSWWADCE